MDSNGWVKSYRSKWSNPVFRDYIEVAMWIWMCEEAAWKDTQTRVNGAVFSLKRGQLVVSLSMFETHFKSTRQATRTFLKNLESQHMVNTQKTNKATIVTICNYETYQDFENASQHTANTQPTQAQHTANTQANTPIIDKEVKKKEVKKKENKQRALALCDNFEKFWDAYGFKAGKTTAQKSYEKAVKKTSHDEIMQAVMMYGEYLAIVGYRKAHAGTWLNQERWQDDYQELITQEKNKQQGTQPNGQTQSSNRSVTEVLRDYAQRRESDGMFNDPFVIDQPFKR